MRMHIIVAALLVAPWAIMSAQDTTQTPTRDTTNQYSNQYNQNQQGPQSDEAILMRIHRTNQMEIRAGQLAQRNASSSKVKSLAARLVKDHTASDHKVTTLAKSMGVTLTRDGMDSTGRGYGKSRYGERNDTTMGRYGQPYDSTQRGDSVAHPSDREGYPRTYGDSTMQGDSTHHGMDWKQLQTLHGAAFDTAFANVMVQGHEKAISMLEGVQGQVQNSQLRTLITSMLPTLRTHLQIAQSLSTNATTTSSSQEH